MKRTWITVSAMMAQALAERYDVGTVRDWARKSAFDAQNLKGDKNGPLLVIPDDNDMLFAATDPFVSDESMKRPGGWLSGSMKMTVVNLTRYAQVREAMQRSGRPDKGLTSAFEPRVAAWLRRRLGLGHPTNGGPWMAEGNFHGDIIAHIEPAFARQSVAALDERIAAVGIDELRRLLVPEPDFFDVARYANAVYFRLIAELLGLTDDFAAHLHKWIAIFNQSPSLAAPKYDARMNRQLRAMISAAEKAGRAGLAVPGILGSVVTARRAGATIGDSTMTSADIASIVWTVIAAGTETPATLTANAVLFALQLDGTWGDLTDVEATADHVAESARYYPPFPQVLMRATEDTEVGNWPIRQGQWVRCHIPAANRDPEAFPDPHRFDPMRPNSRAALSFGAGMHYCIGAHFGQRVAQHVLTTLARELPDASLLPLETYRRHSGPLHRFDTMPIRTGR